jgi:hypothetical protein
VKRIANASAFLSAYFKEIGRLDSAYTYQEIMLAAKDSLYSQQKVKEVQNIFFNEKIRQQELKEARAKAEEEREHNLQMVGIAAFIITFMLFLLMVSKRNLNTKTVEILGVIALLMVFEFISLLIHPFIAHITHHQPVFLLMFLVAIAALLVPLHHRLEHWFVAQLSHRSFARIDDHQAASHLSALDENKAEVEPSGDILI